MKFKYIQGKDFFLLREVKKIPSEIKKLPSEVDFAKSA